MLLQHPHLYQSLSVEMNHTFVVHPFPLSSLGLYEKVTLMEASKGANLGLWEDERGAYSSICHFWKSISKSSFSVMISVSLSSYFSSYFLVHHCHFRQHWWQDCNMNQVEGDTRSYNSHQSISNSTSALHDNTRNRGKNNNDDAVSTNTEVFKYDLHYEHCLTHIFLYNRKAKLENWWLESQV